MKKVKKEKKEKQVDRICVGIIMFKDGWHRMYSDGNNHYTFEKIKE